MSDDDFRPQVPPVGTLESHLMVDRDPHGWDITVQLRALRKEDLLRGSEHVAEQDAILLLAWSVITQELTAKGFQLAPLVGHLPPWIEEERGP